MIAVAITLGFIAGISLPISRSVKPEVAPPVNWLNRQQNPDSNISKVTGLIGQQNQTYKKMVAELAAEEARRLNFSVPVQFQGKTIEHVKLKDDSKTIALTFDDGPWSSATPQILDILKENNIKATFFLVGKHVQRYPQITKQIVTEGHAIGNHSWSHQYHQYSTAAADRELNNTAALVHKLTGVKTTLFRPPAGILNNGLVAYAHQQKYAAIMWSADSKDWSIRSTEKGLIDNVLTAVKPGGIVLLHDGGGNRSKTVQALPKLISELKKRGYQFVTVPELLEMEEK
ncbi:polysaccharide deacetylase family protein [Coleofasciculus sp. LEGE 07092]|nr:polysaccharide deacetylase family protein [Coleofasciculus sp. LEGE 07081]MBE9148332.1 polysaccharide deacetylase family protein [Coleofasciculus sp. LEGE 07092]